MKKCIAFLCIAILSAVSFTSCKGSEETTVKNDELIKIGVLRIADSIPLYVADKDELFEKHGVNAELVEFGNASDQSKAMESGEIDVMMTDMVVQCLIEKSGTEVRTIATALGADIADGRMSVVSAPDGKVKNIENLEGSSVAISEGTQIEYLIDSYCEELGVDINKIEKVSIPSLSLRYETLMENGEVDCALLPDPMSDVALMNGANMIIDDTELKNNYSISVITASKTMTENVELTEKFINAYNEAIDSLENSPENYRELVMSTANIPENMQDTYTIPNYTKNSVPDEKEVANLVEWMVEKKLIDNAYSYEQVVDDSFCKN